MTVLSGRHLWTVAAAALLALVAVPATPPGVAAAAEGRCPAGTGVTVVVDYGPLGGGVVFACDPDGAGKSASQVVRDAGFSLSYVSSQPGFVCRVNGQPGGTEEDCAETPPADAYWGLFWSDADPATWVYSSEGAGSLDVPAGGSIGWRFQDGGTRENPSAAPNPAKQTPSPQPSKDPSPAPTKPPKAADPTPSPTPSASVPPGAGGSGPTPGSNANPDGPDEDPPGQVDGSGKPDQGGERTQGRQGWRQGGRQGGRQGRQQGQERPEQGPAGTGCEAVGVAGSRRFRTCLERAADRRGVVDGADLRRRSRGAAARRLGRVHRLAEEGLTIAVLPRDLHPAAWWVWALGLAAAASRTTNPWLLALVVLVASVTVLSRRTDAPWALSFRLYLLLGLLVVVLRVVFRVIFGGGYGSTMLLELPEIPLPDWAAGITLLGPVMAEAVLGGLYDGMRLAAIIICVGAANSLANPRRLLASLPPALYEVGTAVVIALSLFPQLAESVQRVRRARRLRGDPGRGIGALRRIVVPVLEDALERSLSLAASMDSRGYGRAGDLSPTQRRVTGTLLVGGLLGLVVGIYAFLDFTAPRFLVWPMLLAGLALSAGGFVAAGRRVRRTRYRPDRWRPAELMTAATGIAVAVLMAIAADLRPDVVVPDPGAAPPLSVLALVTVLIGLLPAFATPLPVLHNRVERSRAGQEQPATDARTEAVAR